MTQRKRRGGLLLLPVALLLAALFLFHPLGGDEKPAPSPTPDPYQNDKVQLDPARLGEGVVSLRYTGEEEKRVKVQITREGGADYNYDLNSAGDWETYSLTDGDGSYVLRVLVQKDNGRYSPVYVLPWEQGLSDSRTPFLASTQFVCFSGSQTAQLAAGLTAEAEGDGEKIALLLAYVTGHISYDMEKAERVESGYVPDVDAVLEAGKGICFDYATVLCAMLRSQAVPCKLIMGDAGGQYHAWVEVWSGEGGTAGGISLAAGAWTRLDPTFLAGEPGEEVVSFVSDDGNYQVKYVY